MIFRLLAFSVMVSGFVSLPLRADSAKAKGDDVVTLPPYAIEAKSRADARFEWKARFHDHMIGAGIRELIISRVGPQSEAKKAGLVVGDRILQIWDVKVEGLGLQELLDEIATKAVDGKVSLLIQSKGSDKPRTVMLKSADLVPKKSDN